MGSILLVETDPNNQDHLGAGLVEAGHEVVVASTMRDALQHLSEGGIDVVVIDAYDPRVGVVELAKSMNTLPDAPPLVLVSTSPHAPEISARIGAAAFVAKPCEPGELVQAVRRLVGELRPVRSFDDDPTVRVNSNSGS